MVCISMVVNRLLMKASEPELLRPGSWQDALCRYPSLDLVCESSSVAYSYYQHEMLQYGKSIARVDPLHSIVWRYGVMLDADINQRLAP
jgi:hypothetical protein